MFTIPEDKKKEFCKLVEEIVKMGNLKDLNDVNAFMADVFNISPQDLQDAMNAFTYSTVMPEYKYKCGKIMVHSLGFRVMVIKETTHNVGKGTKRKTFNMIKCRYIHKNGDLRVFEFYPEELKEIEEWRKEQKGN